MNRKIAFTALSLAIMLGGASGALAAGKHHNAAGQAYATETGGQVSDPRNAHQGGSHPTWCDADAQCNGWAAWLQDVSTGKLKN
jgi:hypothetical protein